MNDFDETKEYGDGKTDSVLDGFSVLVNGDHASRLGTLFVILNLLVVLIRPQNELGFLAAMKFPLLVSFLPIGIWLALGIKKVWTPQMWAMLGFLVQGAIWIPLAVNNRMALEGWRGLLQLFVGMSFPIIAFCSNGASLKRLWKVFFFIGIYWFFYGFTHSGCGPGDYLGDENDLGLAMIMMFGFVLGGLNLVNGSFRKLLILGICALLICGIVVSASRGAFVGMVCLMAYLIYKSHRKLLVLMLLGVVFSVGLAVAPKEYIEDIRSISNTDEGTAKQRREYWSVAWAVFVDFDNIIWGVGMKNLPYRVGEYEPNENLDPSGKSIAGRQTHSLYFTLLPELGLIGVYLFLYLFWHSFVVNSRYQKRCKELLQSLEIIQADVDLVDAEMKRRVYEKLKPRATIDEYFFVIDRLKFEIKMIFVLFLGINAAWIGVLSSAAFISVLYYPPIWLLVAVSSALQVYFLRMEFFIDDLAREIQDSVNGSCCVTNS